MNFITDLFVCVCVCVCRKFACEIMEVGEQVGGNGLRFFGNHC